MCHALNQGFPWVFPGSSPRLPRCRCMLSHGGAGVLHSTLRAGIPAIIAPLIGDQFVFAKLIDARELGCLELKGPGLPECLGV